jgi:hypothetical protein
MKRRAHAWVALRALKLVNDSRQAPKLVELLSYYVSDVWDGAWLPDTLIVDVQYGHIFKMDGGSQRLRLGSSQEQLVIEKRMKLPYEQLKEKLSGNRLCLEYVKKSDVLKGPYRAHPKYGGHLPNRVIAISQTITDMLKMSDYPLIFYARRKASKAFTGNLMRRKVKDLSASTPVFSPRQIALMFFILAHYITDAHMPLHCDLRDCRRFKPHLPPRLHGSIEELWESYFPTKEELQISDYSQASIDEIVSKLPKSSIIQIDTNNKYKLSTRIHGMVGDEWREMVYVTRISYAVSRQLIDDECKDVEVLVAKKGEEFNEVTNCIFHDAVESVAKLWLNAWEEFIGKCTAAPIHLSNIANPAVKL